jgi:hypothetical protein
MKTKRLFGAGWVLSLGCVVACSSQAPSRRQGDNGGSESGAIPDDGTRGTPLIAKGESDTKAGQCDAPTASTPPLRRISRIEYNNAVGALFADTTHPADDFVPEAKVAGFSSNVGIPVTDHNVTQYVAAAETIAKNVIAALKSVTGCSATSDTACLDGWLGKTARKAFHGTLPDEEKTQLLADFHAATKDLDADSGLSLAIESILVSPRFLYVVEMGQDGSGIVPLTSSEIAGRLATTLWRSVPDDALLAAADSGALDDGDGVAQQAARMLADPTKQSGSMLDDFVTQWMEIPSVEGLAKDGKTFMTYSTAVRTSAIGETTATFRAVYADASGSFDQLFTLPYTMANSDVAPIYGLSAPGASFTKVMLPDTRRGILMQSAVLAAHSHPVQVSPTLRGKLVRTKVLCDVVADPPPNVMRNLPDPSAMQTEQDVLDMHLNNASCSACHRLMDPIGHGFNGFDAIGQYVGSKGGSTDGEVIAPTIASVDDVSGKFSGPIELVNKLAASDQVKQCFTIQALRYALGRDEVTADACSASQAWERFKSGSYGIKEGLVGVVASDTFRYRTSITAGGACQ